MKTYRLFRKLILFIIIFIGFLISNNSIYAKNVNWPSGKEILDQQPSYGSFAWRGNEYIMSDEALEQAKGNLAKADKFDSKLEALHGFYPPKNGMGPTSYREFPGWHSNVQCSHWFSNKDLRKASHAGLELWFGIFDFNEDGRHPMTGKVYYRKDNTASSDVVSVDIKNINAASLAYVSFYSGKDASENKDTYPYEDNGIRTHRTKYYQKTNGDWVWGEDEDTISHYGWLSDARWFAGETRDYVELWANTWWNYYYDLAEYVRSRSDSVYLDVFRWVLGHKGNTRETNIIDIDDSTAAYRNFVNNIVDEEGYADTIKSSVTELKQNGSTVSGLIFDKFIVDQGIYGGSKATKYNYTNTAEGQGFLDAGTDQTFTIKAILSDNSEVVETYTRMDESYKERVIKVYNSQGEEIKFTDIEKGEEYSLSVSNTNGKAITKIIVSSNYFLFKGRLFIISSLWAADNAGYSQSRNVVGGDRVPLEDKVEFEVIPNIEKYPVLAIKKVDTDGTALKGATFTATFEKDGDTSDPIKGLKTNEAGEILVFSRDIAGLNIGNIYENGGTLKITLKETAAPEGYKLLSSDIVINAVFKNGTVTMTTSSEGASVTVDKIAYKDDKGEEKTLDVGVVTVKNTPDSRIRIRKVDGDTDTQDYLNNAKFTVEIVANGTTKVVTKEVDTSGYIDITKAVNEMVGAIGKYTGDVKVTLTELNNPNGYIKINEKVTVTLKYTNGYLSKITYPDNISRDVIDVGESEDRKDITIVVKNTKNTLQPIYISKLDSQTGAMLSNVDFKVALSTEEITDMKESLVYKTSDDGLIAITKDTLKEIGLTDFYTGELYILMEEVAPKAGYKKLDEEVYIKVTYKNGNIASAEVLSGPADCKIASNNSAKMLKVKVNNEWEIPDLVISKETLSNYYTDLILSANLTVKVKASGKSGVLTKTGVVDKNAQIVFTSAELETLGLNGKYEGTITVTITENSVGDGAVKLPETVTATITMKNGRFVKGEVSNKVHLSIVNNNTSINVKVLNYKEAEDMPISGIVWQELATTKAKGILIDGMYTTASDSEYSDRLFEGIEVTLYKKVGSGLQFVNVTKGTNPTFTDSNGHYEFQAPVGTGYIVKFTYNGENFYSSPSTEYKPLNGELANWKLSSKGSELIGSNGTAGTRTYVNNLLKEIGSYPANYKMNTKLFANSKISTANNMRNAYEAGYNIAYRYDEIEELYNEIATAMKEQLVSKQNINIETEAGLKVLKGVYNTVAGNHKLDKEIYNKLQYIYDSRVSSYAGYNTNGNGIADIASAKTYPYPGDKSKGYEVQQYVNLGLVKRDKTDVGLLTDVYSTRLSMDSGDVVYTFDNGSSSNTQYLYEEDFNYNVTASSNGTAWYESSSALEYYVTYKLTVTNSTKTNTSIKEVVEYFDNRFSYSNSYTTSANNTITGVKAQKVDSKGKVTGIDTVSASTDSKYIDASKIGLTGSKNYSDLYIKFSGNGPSVVDGEKIEIFVTLKLGNNSKNATELFKGGLDKLTNNNYAEINGYGTTAGVLDADSKPGTFNVKAYEDAKAAYVKAYKNRNNDKVGFANALDNLMKIREDDAWGVELKFSIGENYHRTIKGNVWDAVSDSVKTAADLKGNNTLLTYVQGKGIEGIVVELVELDASGKQVVRARTVTKNDGSYELSKFRPGDYVVRFVYGASTRDGYSQDQINKIAEAAKTYNGITYQSTKANPDTDKAVQWYKENANTRYSDAYDDVGTVLKNDAAAAEYTYEDVLINELTANKTVYAYTSRIEVSFGSGVGTTETVDGTNPEAFSISNVDFGLTPRTTEDISLNKYVSNVKVYLQDGTLQLNANIGENGEVTYLNDERYTNIVNVVGKTNAYRDGLIEALIDENLLNGATLEITYTVKAKNEGQDSSFSVIYSKGKGSTPVGIIYYGEDYKSLPYYEGKTDTIVYHDNDNEKYSLEKYNSTATKQGQTRISDLVDYIDPNLSFVLVNKAGEKVNSEWTLATTDSFKSSRKLNADLMNKYATIIRPTQNSELFKTIEKGETKSATLTLSTVLSTTSTGTNEYEYSNLMEITKIYSTSGRMPQIKGYDITGETRPETSEPISLDEIKDNIYPTIGTAKSETLVIHAPTGLNSVERIAANTGIVLLALVVLAGGIVLIKKFVLKTNN